MSVETDRLTLRLIPPDEARRIVEGKPAEHDSWADGFPREDDADGLRMLARAEPRANPGTS